MHEWANPHKKKTVKIYVIDSTNFINIRLYNICSIGIFYFPYYTIIIILLYPVDPSSDNLILSYLLNSRYSAQYGVRTTNILL